MPRAMNPKAEKAEALFRKGLKLIDIATELGVPAGTVRRWKNTYGWNNERSDKKKANVRNKKTHRNSIAQLGNKNATGPPGNRNAEKYGFFSKFLPEETQEIMGAVDQASPLDLLWHQIQIAYAAIIRAQRIAYVKDQEDMTVVKVGRSTGKIISEKFEVQHAWDKQNNFLAAQARAQSELRSLIKQYDEMLHRDWELATEEQKARIEKIKADTAKTKGTDAELEDISDIEAEVYDA